MADRMRKSAERPAAAPLPKQRPNDSLRIPPELKRQIKTLEGILSVRSTAEVLEWLLAQDVDELIRMRQALGMQGRAKEK